MSAQATERFERVELPGALNIDLRNAILFLEDCTFHEWAHKEVVTALRHRGGFEPPRHTPALQSSIRELQLALERQRQDMDLALLSRGQALREGLQALARHRQAMYPLVDAVAACRSAAEPTVLFGSTHYSPDKWPPPERRATYAEAKEYTPAGVFLKEKLGSAALRYLHVFEAVLYARACAAPGGERGFKYVSYNAHIVPLYNETMLQETFAHCRFQDLGANWRASAAAFWQGRAWRHESAARSYLAALRFPALVLAKNEEPDYARAHELYWPMLCAIERRLGLATYETPDC